MQILRRSTSLARFVLACFLVAVGAATAAPLVHPKAMELVCTAGGAIQWVMADTDADGDGDSDATTMGAHTLDCALCLPAALPASPAVQAAREPLPRLRALHPFTSAEIVALLGAPLPPRGPPVAA